MRKYASKPVGKSPKPTSDAVSLSMKSNRSTGTGPEVALAKLLGKSLVRSDLPGRPDFVYLKSKLAVFVHGCFWHRCPVHAKALPKTHTAFWRRKFERNVERDELNRRELESMGWTVIEIWEHELKENPKAVVSRVKAAVGKSPRRSGVRNAHASY